MGTLGFLFAAVQRGGDVTSVVSMIQSLTSWELDQAIEGVTILTEAVLSGNYRVVQALASKNCNMNATSRVYDEDKKVWRHESPLVTAARMGSIAVVGALLEAGAMLDLADHGQGKSALHWACASGQWKVVELLVKGGAAVNQTDFYWETPLVEAIGGSKSLDMVRTLVDYGADVNRPLSYDHDTSVILALLFHQPTIARYLVSVGANVNAVNKYGDDALSVALSMTASREEVEYIIRLLLCAGASVKPGHFSKLQSTLQHPDSFVDILKDIILAHGRSPVSLTGSCRKCIRSVLLKHHGHQRILQAADELPTPRLVIQYLKFECL